MNGRVFSFGSSGNPLVQILSLLAFGALLTVALIMGAVVIAVILGLAVIAGIVLSVRVWWLRRKFRGGPPFDAGSGPPGPGPGNARLIEGEYVVVKKPDADAERRNR